MSEKLVYAFHEGVVYSFVKASERTFSTFGGPPSHDVIGVPAGRKPLHQICELSSQHIPNIHSIPLLYGMYYDGCLLRYRVGTKIELIELRETSVVLDGWPYPNFPPLLPYFSMKLARKEFCSYEKFVESFPNMPEAQPAELVVAVPPPATIGVSLWGAGDLDDVTIVFECDLKTRTVYSYNVTT